MEKKTELVVTSAATFAPTTIDPQALIVQALQTGAGIDVLERLTALAKDVARERARSAWYAAIAEFQRQCPTIRKTRTASMGKYSFKYAPLAEIMELVSPVLAPLGLSIAWRTRTDAGYVYATAIVSHALGHSETSGELAVPIVTSDPNSGSTPAMRVGIALAYAKRYTACIALGIAPADEDTATRQRAERTVTQPRRTTAAEPENIPAPPEPPANRTTRDGDTKPRPSAELNEWRGNVIAVHEKSGKTGDKAWTLYTIVGADADGNEKVFGTFDANYADFARGAVEDGEPVAIVWKLSAKNNPMVETIGNVGETATA